MAITQSDDQTRARTYLKIIGIIEKHVTKRENFAFFGRLLSFLSVRQKEKESKSFDWYLNLPITKIEFELNETNDDSNDSREYVFS